MVASSSTRGSQAELACTGAATQTHTHQVCGPQRSVICPNWTGSEWGHNKQRGAQDHPRDVLEGGEGGGGSEGGEGGGFGWDTPAPRVLLWSPPKAGRKFLNLNSLGTEGAEAKFWLSASNIGRGGGGGGTPPPPPTVHGRSNTSLDYPVHRTVLHQGTSAEDRLKALMVDLATNLHPHLTASWQPLFVMYKGLR